MENDELREETKGFEVDELDDSDLDDVAGGAANNCDCTINNCEKPVERFV